MPVSKGQRIKTIHDWGFGYHIKLSVNLPAAGSENKSLAIMSVLQAGATDTTGDRLPVILINAVTKKLKVKNSKSF